MDNDQLNQTLKQIQNAKNILIIAGDAERTDAIVAGLALHQFLDKHEKQSMMVSAGSVPKKLKLFPQIEQLKPATAINKNLLIQISTKDKQVDELRYQKTDESLGIFLSAKEGEFAAADVSIRDAVYAFDLVVLLGVSNLQNLGKLYEKQAQLFFELPLINIDYRVENENYGQANLVSLTSCGVSEIIFDLINAWDPVSIDQQAATLLLSGIIMQTNSFQTAKASPQAFLKASQLMGLGAKQQDIISWLYRTKSLAFLRLWGRVLARIKQDNNLQLVYSGVTSQDVARSEASEEDIEGIIYEMVEQLSSAKTFLFFCEAAGTVAVFLHTVLPINLIKLFTDGEAEKSGSVWKFVVKGDLLSAETEIAGKIRSELAKYLA